MLRQGVLSRQILAEKFQNGLNAALTAGVVGKQEGLDSICSAISEVICGEKIDRECVLLADVHATMMSTRQMEFLKRHVSDFGSGLAMLGSENSFGLGGYFRTPVEEASPLTSRYEKEKQKLSLAMVLVITLARDMWAQGMTVLSAFLGDGAAKSLMEMIATEGGGRYYETNDPRNMPQIFTKETMQDSVPRSRRTSTAR